MITCELIGPILNMNLCHLNLFSVKNIIITLLRKQRLSERIQGGGEGKRDVFDAVFFFFFQLPVRPPSFCAPLHGKVCGGANYAKGCN